VSEVQIYLQVLKVRKLLQEADLRAKSLAARIPAEELMELLAKLQACHEVVEKLLARAPRI
jgi:hypothetical protein